LVNIYRCTKVHSKAFEGSGTASSFCSILISSLARSLQGSPLGLARRKEKARAIRTGALKRTRVKEQRCSDNANDRMLIIQDTPPCRPAVVKEITGGFV
jgi:hypothetical protein